MQKSMKKHAQHGFSQFEITQEIVTNLKQFDVTPTAKLVLVYLSTCYNPKKADMFPKQKTIADRIGVSERSVVRAIQELIKAGLILVESKYSNHYIFTSKIARECPQNEKNFCNEKMSEDLCKNDISNRDNLSQHEHEQIREQKKEPVSVENFKILKEYAERHRAKRVNNYINYLQNSGVAAKIIQDYKTKERVDAFYKNQIEETLKKNAENKQIVAENPKECEHLQNVLNRLRHRQ